MEETSKTNMRLLLYSETKRRCPVESYASPSGRFVPFCVVAAVDETKLGWPSTLSATRSMRLLFASRLNTMTRLFLSATKRRWLTVSNAKSPDAAANPLLFTVDDPLFASFVVHQTKLVRN